MAIRALELRLSRLERASTSVDHRLTVVFVGPDDDVDALRTARADVPGEVLFVRFVDAGASGGAAHK